MPGKETIVPVLARKTSLEKNCPEEDQIPSLNLVPVPIPPPDGGWGWVIVLASFLSNVIVDGIANSFGIFLPHFLLSFGGDVSSGALVGSLLGGFFLLVGPIVSGLVNRYEARPVMIAGAVFASFAFFISYWANSMVWLMLTFGIMGGIGFGLIYLPATVCVGYYFEKRRALATGLCVAGSGFGTIVFPPLCAAMLTTFTWRGSMWILAGITLNCAICGSLMRALPKKNVAMIELKEDIAAFKQLDTNGTIQPDEDLTFICEHPPPKEMLPSTEVVAKKLHPFQRLNNHALRYIEKMVDVDLIKNPIVLMLCLSNFLCNVAFYTPFVYLPMYAESLNLGITSNQTSFLLSIIGITNTLARVFYGWLSDRGWVRPLTIYCVTMVLCGVLTCFVPLMQSYGLLMTYSAVFGFLVAPFICLMSIILVNHLGLQKLTNAFGWIILVRGIACFISAPLVGFIYTKTSNYDASFIFSGVVMVLAGLISCIIPMMEKFAEHKLSSVRKDVIIPADQLLPAV